MRKCYGIPKYISISLYTHLAKKNILGIAHLPYYLSSYPLEGLNKGDYFLSHEVEYPHCVSINSNYIYVNSNNEYYYDRCLQCSHMN